MELRKLRYAFTHQNHQKKAFLKKCITSGLLYAQIPVLERKNWLFNVELLRETISQHEPKH